jgi:hypothetical protein
MTPHSTLPKAHLPRIIFSAAWSGSNSALRLNLPRAGRPAPDRLRSCWSPWARQAHRRVPPGEGLPARVRRGRAVSKSLLAPLARAGVQADYSAVRPDDIPGPRWSIDIQIIPAIPELFWTHRLQSFSELARSLRSTRTGVSSIRVQHPRGRAVSARPWPSILGIHPSYHCG